MMASWQAAKNVTPSDLENVGQCHHLQNLLYLSYYLTNFYQSFIEMMAMWSAIIMSSADLENTGQGHHLQKALYLRYYTSDFN